MVDFGDNCCFINRFKPAVMMWMMSLHHGKGVSRLKQSESIHFGDF
jgi:hypothetical protein